MTCVTTTHPRKARMFRIALIVVGGLLAVTAPVAAAQPVPPRTSSFILENTMVSGLHAAPGTQVGSVG
jgi:hypothetical protein